LLPQGLGLAVAHNFSFNRVTIFAKPTTHHRNTLNLTCVNTTRLDWARREQDRLSASLVQATPSMCPGPQALGQCKGYKYLANFATQQIYVYSIDHIAPSPHSIASMMQWQPTDCQVGFNLSAFLTHRHNWRIINQQPIRSNKRIRPIEHSSERLERL
jgi:hypothetical protein